MQEVLDLLREFDELYRTGEIPDLSTAFRVDLFNTYRAALFPHRYPITLRPHTDARGTFVETVRCHGGEGQTFISTTVPGVTRGEHYHLRKVERFVVVSGHAPRIALRRMFTDEVVDVRGRPATRPAPSTCQWVGAQHHQHRRGRPDHPVLAHELFRPDAPDTFPQPRSTRRLTA